MSRLAETDFSFQERVEEFDQIAIAKIQRSMLWSMETWGGDRCAGCGLKVKPRCQIDMGGWFENEQGQRTGVFHAFGNACNSSLFFGKCPGENPNWMMEQSE